MNADLSEKNLAQLFFKRAEKFGDKTALQVKREGVYQPISWNEFARQVQHFALGLHFLGIRKGDRVSLLSENRPEWAVCDFAILSLGAVNVPIYPTSAPAEVRDLLNHSGSKILVVSTREQLERLKGIRSECKGVERIITLDRVSSSDTSVLYFGEVTEYGVRLGSEQKSLFALLLEEASPEDLASIIYTSGTTGQPKGVMLTHANFISNADSCAQILPVGPGDNSLSFLPLSHVFERMAGYYLLIRQGVTIAYAENMTTVPENLMEVRPTVVASVPRLYEKMYSRVLEQVARSSFLKKRIFFWALGLGRKVSALKMKGGSISPLLRCLYSLAKILVFNKFKAKLGGRLRFFISGGAPLSKEIAEFFHAADVMILEGYGLTETSPVVSVNRVDRYRFGSVGLPIPGVSVKIGPDEEILVQGPNVMKGYFKDEEATRETLREGWLYTGDIGRIDSEGFIWITDRKKELLITSGGKNIPPQKIENLLIADKYIAQICVCGDRRHYLTALVVPDFGPIEEYAHFKGISFTNRRDLVRNEQINDLIARRIEARSRDFAPYERIKYFTLLEQEFAQEKGELTPTLKLRRKVINARFQNQIDRMYVGKEKTKASKTGEAVEVTQSDPFKPDWMIF